MILTRRQKRHEKRKPLAHTLRKRYLMEHLIFDRHGRRRYASAGDPKGRFHERRCIATRGGTR